MGSFEAPFEHLIVIDGGPVYTFCVDISLAKLKLTWCLVILATKATVLPITVFYLCSRNFSGQKF